MPTGMLDVLIRGAGPVGCVAALALQGSAHEVRLVDRGAGSPAFRPIVLSYASRLILERVGAWRSLAATPIDTIHVSQAGARLRGRVCRAARRPAQAAGRPADPGGAAGALRGARRGHVTGRGSQAL